MLQSGLGLYYTGFWDLCSCRSFGGGSEGPIPWTAAEMYCTANGIEGLQREDFHHHIGELDEAYLDYRAKKAEAKAKAKKGS